MERRTIEEVFPTTGTPKYTYRARAGFEGEVRSYAECGTGILSVFGPTKAGKSVLVTKLMPDALHVRGDVDDAGALWAAAATELEPRSARFTEATFVGACTIHPPDPVSLPYGSAAAGNVDYVRTTLRA